MDKNIEFKALINYYLTKAGYSKIELATKLHISKSSLYQKLSNPDCFTVKEIRMMRSVLGIPDTDINFIF